MEYEEISNSKILVNRKKREFFFFFSKENEMNMSKGSNKTLDNLKKYDFVSGEENLEPNTGREGEKGEDKAGFESQEENELKALSKVMIGRLMRLY